MTRLLITVSITFLLLQACSSGNSSSENTVDTTPDWIINVDTTDSGTSLNTALLGHYDLSGTLYNYDTVSSLVTNMQAVGFSEWRVSVGRWEIGTEMLPTLTDSTPCPVDAQLTNQTLTDLELISTRSWFTDDTNPVTIANTLNDARYDLTYVRSVIDMATTFGATAFVSIDAMPLALSDNRIPNRTDCTTSFMNAVSNRPPADNDVFSSAVVGLVQRIVEGSDSEPARPVTHFEVWNEPEFPFFWHNGLASNPDLFFNMASTTLLYLNAYRSESFNPDVQALKFGLASFANATTAVSAINAYDAASIDSPIIPIDFISFHSYHNDPRDIAADIELVADAVANSSFYTDLELVLAEWGSDLELTSGNASFANSMQPPLLMSSTIAMSAALGLDRAHHSLFYDFHPAVTLGLIDNNGQPKPLYRAYELLSEMITEGSVMLSSSAASGNKLNDNAELLITRDSGGTARALFINRDSRSYTARMENLTGTMTPLQMKVFDDHTTPITTTTPSNTIITIPAQSLVLVQY